MADLNNVVLIGRLTKDATLKYTQSGTPVADFSIAVNKSVKQGDEYTDDVSFFDVHLWNKQAETLQQYLTKGKQVAISGSLKQDRWQDNDGQNRSRIVINAQSVQLLGGNNASQPLQNNYVQQNNYQNNRQQQQRQSAYNPPKQRNENLQPDYHQNTLDNIPF